jgi:serine/threonine-protein kinase HipA
MRDNGYLRTAARWRLAPAYDLNPVPTDVRPRIHALALDEIHDEASLDTALQAAPPFGLAHAEAPEIASAVGSAVAGWRAVAAQCGLNAAQVERMHSAFEHSDLEKATGARALAAPARRPRR